MLFVRVPGQIFAPMAIIDDGLLFITVRLSSLSCFPSLLGLLPLLSSAVVGGACRHLLKCFQSINHLLILIFFLLLDHLVSLTVCDDLLDLFIDQIEIGCYFLLRKI